MKSLVCIVFGLLFVVRVFSQDHCTDTLQPNIEINTQREYDEEGNLVRIDSVYTYSYRSDDFSDEQLDSLFCTQDDELYRMYNLDHYLNRPMTGLPYRFHFDFNDDFYRNFNWHEGYEPDWELIDSTFQNHIKSFKENMDELFEDFYDEENIPDDTEDEVEETIDI